MVALIISGYLLSVTLGWVVWLVAFRVVFLLLVVLGKLLLLLLLVVLGKLLLLLLLVVLGKLLLLLLLVVLGKLLLLFLLVLDELFVGFYLGFDGFLMDNRHGFFGMNF
jgi:hypothetical protein